MKPIQIIFKSVPSLLRQFGTVPCGFHTLRQASGKDQAGGLVAFSAVGSGQPPEDLKDAGSRQVKHFANQLAALHFKNLDHYKEPMILSSYYKKNANPY